LKNASYFADHLIRQMRFVFGLFKKKKFWGYI